MNRRELYNLLEGGLGRRTLWKLGRWLYQGSRRELHNDPEVNGEYALQGWLASAWTVSPGKLVVCDVGANLGEWSSHALAAFRQAGLHDFLIHAFEPAPAQYRSLCERLGDEIERGRVVADPRGLSAAPGQAAFSITGERTGDNAIAPDGVGGPGSASIEVTTLRAVCDERGYPELHLVKVDTEGNDFNVIKGALDLLRQGRVGVLQFEYNWRWIAFRHNLKDVFEAVEGLSYTPGRLTGSEIEFYREWHPELDRFIETNYVLVRSDMVRLLPHCFVAFDGANTPVEERAPRTAGR